MRGSSQRNPVPFVPRAFLSKSNGPGSFPQQTPPVSSQPQAAGPHVPTSMTDWQSQVQPVIFCIQLHACVNIRYSLCMDSCEGSRKVHGKCIRRYKQTQGILTEVCSVESCNAIFYGLAITDGTAKTGEILVFLCAL